MDLLMLGTLFGGTGSVYEDDGSVSTYSSATGSTNSGTTYTSAGAATIHTRATTMTNYTADKTECATSSTRTASKSNNMTKVTMCMSTTNSRRSSGGGGNKAHTIASVSSKDSTTSTRATPRTRGGNGGGAHRSEGRDDDENTISTMYTTATGTTGRTSYCDGDDDDDTNTTYTHETGFTAASSYYNSASGDRRDSSPWWTAFLPSIEEENDTVISATATATNAHPHSPRDFMTLAKRDDEDDDWTQYTKLRNTTMLTYSHGSDDQTTAAVMSHAADEGNNIKGRGSSIPTRKLIEMRKQLTSNLNSTWFATKAKVTAIAPTETIVVPANKGRTRRVVGIVGKAKRELCTC